MSAGVGRYVGAQELARYQQWTDEELTAYDDVLARVFPHALSKR